MSALPRFAAQLAAYGAFVAVIGYFSASPTYTHVDPGLGLIRLSFSHAGARSEECRRYTPEELAQLAPNMRRPMDCARERVALYVEFEIDDAVVYRAQLPPAGLARDGASTAYQRIAVTPGRHRIAARLRDSRRESGFDWEFEEVVDVAPRQSFVVDFEAQTGGFKLL